MQYVVTSIYRKLFNKLKFKLSCFNVKNRFDIKYIKVKNTLPHILTNLVGF